MGFDNGHNIYLKLYVVQLDQFAIPTQKTLNKDLLNHQ